MPLLEVEGLAVNYGEKRHVTFAAAATRLLVLARTGTGPGDGSLFLVDPHAADVSLKQTKSLASDTQYDVHFDGVRVPATARLGAENAGWHLWDAAMLDGIIAVAAVAMGGCERALEITVQYAKDRKQFDKPIGAFQAISHYLADAVTQLDGGKTLVYEAATARKLRTTSSVTIATGGALHTAATGSVTTDSLVVGGNLTNNGNLTFTGPWDFNGGEQSLTISNNVLFTGPLENGRIIKQGTGKRPQTGAAQGGRPFLADAGRQEFSRPRARRTAAADPKAAPFPRAPSR